MAYPSLVIVLVFDRYQGSFRRRYLVSYPDMLYLKYPSLRGQL